MKTVRESVDRWRNFAEVLEIHPQYSFASSLNNLAIMLMEKEQYEEALELLREAIAHGEQVLKQDPSDFGRANVIRESIAFGEQVVIQAPKDFGRANLARHWTNLGECFDHLGKWDEAIAAYQQVVELREQLVRDRPAEPDHLRSLAGAFDSIADMQRNSGQLQESEQNFRRAFELQQQFNEAFPDDAATDRWQERQAQSHWQFGELLKDSGRLNEAADEFRLAFEICPQNHNNKGAYLLVLARVQDRLGQFSEAREILQQSEKLQRELLEAHSRIHGPEHSDTLYAMNELAWGLTIQGKFEEARTLAQQALDLQKHVLGREHAGTLRTQDTLAEAMEGLGHWAEARALREEVLKLLGGRKHRDTGAFMDRLAWNIALTEDALPDDRQRAIELAEEAVELESKNEGFWRTLGVAYAVSGNCQKSLEAFEHALELGYRDELVPPSILERLRQSDDGDDDLRNELLEFLRENAGESEPDKRSPTNSTTAAEQNSDTE